MIRAAVACLFFSIVAGMSMAGCDASPASSVPAPASTATASPAVTEVTPPTVTAIATNTPPDEVWAALRARPLWLPRVEAGAACPATPSQKLATHYPPVYGTGPIYALAGPITAAGWWTYGAFGQQVMDQRPAPPGTWYGMKVLWVSMPGYRGPALIRGQQLDGPGEVRFSDGGSVSGGANLSEAMRFSADFLVSSNSGGTANGWNERPSGVALRSPGCYAFQIDGLDFTTAIVFRAGPSS